MVGENNVYRPSCMTETVDIVVTVFEASSLIAAY